MRIIQITERDKMELSELGHKAIKSVHEFLECLDKVTDGQISQEMAEYYGERQGVKGTGPYSRYNRRESGGNQGNFGERNGYNEHYPVMPGGYMPPYFGTREPQMPSGGYGERSGYGGNYNNRYDY